MSTRNGRAADADADRPVRLAAPSPKAVVRIVAIVVACALFLYLAWRLRDVLRLVVISVFVALALLPVVDAIDTRVRLPRAAVILALYATLAAGVVIVGVVVVPSTVKEVEQISRDAPHYAQDLRLFEQRRTPTRGGVPHFFKGMRRVPPMIGREVADGCTWDEMWAAPVADSFGRAADHLS